MKGITSRLQVFLAKIAGKEVDVSTLTPPVAINEEEKLMLDIADRIDAIEEGGGGGGALIVNATEDAIGKLVLDRTWKEIFDAGPLVWLKNEDNLYFPILQSIEESGVYACMFNKSFYSPDEPEFTFVTDSETGYPSYGEIE